MAAIAGGGLPQLKTLAMALHLQDSDMVAFCAALSSGVAEESTTTGHAGGPSGGMLDRR